MTFIRSGGMMVSAKSHRFSFPRSDRFSEHLRQDLKLWLLCLFFLQAYRIFFICVYHYMILDPGWRRALFLVMEWGFLMDALVASWFVLVPFSLGLVCGFIDCDRLADRVRRMTSYAMTLSFFLLGIINYGYFKEFHTPMDDQVFQIYYDDTAACFRTQWAEHNMILYGLVFVACTSILVFFIQWYFRGPLLGSEGRFARFTLRHGGIVAAGFLVFSLSGSLLFACWHQPELHRPVKVTQDRFLSQNVFNVYLHFWRGLLDHLYLTRLPGGLLAYLPDREISRALREVFPEAGEHDNLDDYYSRTALGGLAEPPQHVFLIIGEGYDSWPLFEKYRPLGLIGNFERLAREGIYWTNILSGSFNTIYSLGVILTGLPDTGKLINFHPSSSSPYPSALPETFRRLGYRTRFFYGGYAFRQKIGAFCRSQGFDEVIAQPESLRAEYPWGVDDKVLFGQVMETAGDSFPSFNMVLMTNNHPPYRPLSFFRQRGFPLSEIPSEVLPLCDQTFDMRAMASKWYTDACIGDFVEKMEKKVDRPLFIIMGDHYGRRFVNANPSLIERKVVPLLLYGKEVLDDVSCSHVNVGCHLDIAPTIIELCAPRGFSYHSLGRNLLAHEYPKSAISRDLAATPEYIVDLQWDECEFFQPGTGKTMPKEEVRKLKCLHDALHGIAWWRIEYGNSL